MALALPRPRPNILAVLIGILRKAANPQGMAAVPFDPLAKGREAIQTHGVWRCYTDSRGITREGLWTGQTKDPLPRSTRQ